MKGLRAGTLVGALAATAAFAAAAHAQTPVSPEVVHTGTGPTGYAVTFRIQDATANRMRIKGEWSFSSAADSSASPPTSAGRLPSQWQVGDFPIASPNATAANWPVADMVKDANGVWTYTTPLPSGVFTYQYFKDCDAAAPALSGCTPLSDPSNPPWNTRGSVERSSQVYVPSDPAFGTVDYAWQAPLPAAQRGKLESVSYPSPGSTNPVGSHDLAVYLPPGYDAARAKPYPLFIISHGGGGNEIDWSTQGASASIVDHLIASGQMQPAVVVATNFNGIAGGNAGYAADVRNAVIPFVEARYNVSRSASGRAFAGLSAGGARANELLLNNTTAFGYFGVWAAAGSVPAATDPVWAKPEFKQLLGLHIGGGIQDPIVATTLTEQARFAAAGVPFVSNMVNGGHEWYVWRLNLRDYLTKVAFRATTTAVVPGAGTLTATVTPATDQPAVPTGTVQVLSGGAPLGPPVALVDGKATLSVPNASGPVTVAYSGDTLYNAGTSAVSYAATSTPGSVGGSVPATLSLALATPAPLGPFVPGVAKTYSTSSAATVTSTAGNALLSVAGPSHLANGAFTLPEPLQVSFSKAAWSQPVANDAVTIGYVQPIRADDPLRTGTYSTTLTFTLSTTQP